jgi:hypothetical protein|uniref:B30.2/SPRY domain-containing protein n=1 Tax=Eutreptiella gymnastica TaxID=73025 RepID=A0A7S4C7J1_9EUGL|eukprot:CAMPEP_0174293008 /NCGR_PEP_ID=MMETSP0809-20121228/37204_1 /TAXON_ID=73025 ORGANISM="Eutreptiella gymnastica-like, Strain CCMP1594" /NCGR_SAMPLE_ID=MMETSP0809 /ASSEMBLY_ACC=CAM_ASM_000658 /LENGTH=304 /DNA_ID=CAMNT_0015393491 /DNA_START=48 /DNA_END=962 /DNA_ORIENTATION=+
MPGQWLDDGSETIQGEGPVVSCNANAKGDAVFHALWKEESGVSSGVHFWEVEDKGGLGGVGLTTLDKFQKGYGCRMFNFNSINLSDGGALLVGQYGTDSFKAGDKVGMLCEMTDVDLSVTFYHNGKCLGTAFKIAHPYPTELFPVITFKKGDSCAELQKLDTIPQTRDREPSGKPFPEGDWHTDVHVQGLPEAHRVTLKISLAGEGVYRASLKVCNNAMIQLTKKDQYEWEASANAAMTMMMGPPELMKLEQEFIQFFQGVSGLDEQGGNLQLVSCDGDSCAMKMFYPGGAALAIPITKNPLER